MREQRAARLLLRISDRVLYLKTEKKRKETRISAGEPEQKDEICSYVIDLYIFMCGYRWGSTRGVCCFVLLTA